MATYQELTQLRPSVIAGLTRNHNIHLDPDPMDYHHARSYKNFSRWSSSSS